MSTPTACMVWAQPHHTYSYRHAFRLYMYMYAARHANCIVVYCTLSCDALSMLNTEHKHKYNIYSLDTQFNIRGCSAIYIIFQFGKGSNWLLPV